MLPAAIAMRRAWADITGWWLAVEVSGRGSRIYDRDFKHTTYPRLGVQEAWRADLADRCVYVTRGVGGPVTRHDERVSWQPPGIAEPLTIGVTEIFEDIEDDWG